MPHIWFKCCFVSLSYWRKVYFCFTVRRFNASMMMKSLAALYLVFALMAHAAGALAAPVHARSASDDIAGSLLHDLSAERVQTIALDASSIDSDRAIDKADGEQSACHDHCQSLPASFAEQGAILASDPGADFHQVGRSSIPPIALPPPRFHS